ncbi:MAG: peptide deformylase [Acholeplasmatales bacterium]|nr:peptide deformylase [Acholeplasmatales bacterium]
MIRDIIIGEHIFNDYAKDANPLDLFILEDLIDTLKANLNRCVGMAANMIGYNKKIIVFVDDNNKIGYMINPKIIKKEIEYETEESCLSLKESHKAVRYKSIKVEFYNDKFQKRLKNFNGFVAQIIQHEIDHLNKIII